MQGGNINNKIMKTIPAVILILLGIFICYLLLIQNITPPIDPIFKPSKELLQRDSIIAVLRSKNDSISKKISMSDSIITILRKRSNYLASERDKAIEKLKGLTGNEQVSLFVNNYNHDTTYTGESIIPIQAAYRANITYESNNYCHKALTIRDSIIDEYATMIQDYEIMIDNCNYSDLLNDSIKKEYKRLINECDSAYTLLNVKYQKRGKVNRWLWAANAVQLVLHGIR